MEKYLAAAERISRAAIFGPGAMKPTLVRLRHDRERFEPSPKVETDYDTTGLSLPNALHGMHRFPGRRASTSIRVVVGGITPGGFGAGAARAVDRRHAGRDGDARSGEERVVCR